MMKQFQPMSLLQKSRLWIIINIPLKIVFFILYIFDRIKFSINSSMLYKIIDLFEFSKIKIVRELNNNLPFITGQIYLKPFEIIE